MLRGVKRSFPPIKILTDEQVGEIHKATLSVLWKTGITINHNKALKLCEENGCHIDYEDKRVHFPPDLVKECISKAPSSFHIKARDSKSDVLIGGDTLHFASGPGMQSVDLDSWEMRTPTRRENYDGVKVMDALENIDILCCYTPYFGFKDVPPTMAMLESQAARIRYSTKIPGFAYSNDCEIFSIAMAQAVGTEALGNFNSSPPLTIDTDAVEACFRFNEAGFPFNVTTAPVMGGSAPATYAGATIITNAEMLASVVLIQLIKPGARILATDFTLPQDMRTGAPAFGQIGHSIHQMIFNQIWRKYEVPTCNAGAGFTNSKRIDFQNAYERVVALLLHALSGANNAWFAGAVHGELTFSPVMAILDNDIAGMIGRLIEGVEVNDETMAVELINEVGPLPGFYLNREHTRKWWKKEQFVPTAADRLTYPEWTKSGKKSCVDYAKERMQDILATHRVSKPLTPSQEEEIERILNEARKYYREKGMISDEEWEVYMKDLRSPSYPYG